MEKDLVVDSETGPLSKEGIKKLKLVACKVSGLSGDHSYLKQLGNVSQWPGEMAQNQDMMQLGQDIGDGLKTVDYTQIRIL